MNVSKQFAADFGIVVTHYGLAAAEIAEAKEAVRATPSEARPYCGIEIATATFAAIAGRVRSEAVPVVVPGERTMSASGLWGWIRGSENLIEVVK